MDQTSGAIETFSAVLVSLRPAKELGVVLSVGETEVMVVAGDRPLDRGPLARSEIRRAGANEFLLLIEGRGWQIRVDDVAAFATQVLPRFGQGRFSLLRAWWASWLGLRDPSNGTLRLTPWVVASGLAWVVVLVVGFGLGRLESGVAAVVTWVVAVIVALLGLRWARSTARARPEERPPAAILRPVVPESVTHSAVNVGMAGDVDLVREILGDRISGRQKLVTAAPRPTAPTAAPGSIPAPPVTGEVLSGVPLDSRSETGSRAGNGNGVVEADQGSLEGPGESGPGGRQPDDLTTIRGIGPRLAARLADAGVVTFRQLADMGAEDIARLQAELGTFVHRMEKDRWKEQAQQAHARKYGG